MEENTKLWEYVINRVENLKAIELKYDVLVGYIKSEANDIYFDREKILKFINILDQKNFEELKKEKSENEQS